MDLQGGKETAFAVLDLKRLVVWVQFVELPDHQEQLAVFWAGDFHDTVRAPGKPLQAIIAGVQQVKLLHPAVLNIQPVSAITCSQLLICPLHAGKDWYVTAVTSDLTETPFQAAHIVCALMSLFSSALELPSSMDCV